MDYFDEAERILNKMRNPSRKRVKTIFAKQASIAAKDFIARMSRKTVQNNDGYCLRSAQGLACNSIAQCVHCQLYQEMVLPPRYPVPVLHCKTPDPLVRVYINSYLKWVSEWLS